MSSILLKQLKEGRFRSIATEYVRVFGQKSPKELNHVIPQLSSNLMKSCESFVEALFHQDVKFIESTSTKALKKVLIKEFEELKRSHTQIKRIPTSSTSEFSGIKQETKKGEVESVSKITISPYVIFQRTMKERYEQEKPWEDTFPIFSPSRFLYLNPIEDLSLDTWNKLRNCHIYGFHCHYFNPNFSYQIIDKSTKTQYPPQQFVISFETDSKEHEFYISDFNYLFQMN